jgi:hypothetical protein
VRCKALYGPFTAVAVPGAVCQPEALEVGRKGLTNRVRAERRLHVARLKNKYGDARLTDLRNFLTIDCPNRAIRSIHAQCEAKYDPPPETKRELPTW